MLLVTDTHPLIFYFSNSKGKLSKKATRAFNAAVEGSTAIYIPVPVFWELSILCENGTIQLEMPFDTWIDKILKLPMFIVYEFDLDTIKLIHNANFSKDPFDRSIVATALQLDLPLITKDAQIHKSEPCKIFWD